MNLLSLDEQSAVDRTKKQLRITNVFNKLAFHTTVYGREREDSKSFDDSRNLDGQEDRAVLETVTVYTRKLEDGDFVIADIAVGYNMNGASLFANPHHAGKPFPSHLQR